MMLVSKLRAVEDCLLQRRKFTVSTTKLIASAILVRTPIILPDPTPFEEAYTIYKTELLYAKTKRLIEFFKTENKLPPQAELDRESEQLLEQSPLASRVAPPEIERDLHSTNRRLDSYLYLIVKQSDRWKFPESEHNLDRPLHEVRTFYGLLFDIIDDHPYP